MSDCLHNFIDKDDYVWCDKCDTSFTHHEQSFWEQCEKVTILEAKIKTLEAENALLKESNERLENSLREFKVFGTDECTECVNEKGRAHLGESYNRITLFYKPKEHSIHKQN